MRLDEINRRGFLRGAAAAAAAPVLSKSEVSNVINSFVKDIGGLSNLEIMSKISQLANPWEIAEISGYLADDILDTESLLTGDEMNLLDKIGQKNGLPENGAFSKLNSDFYEIENTEDRIKHVEKILGKKIVAHEMLDIVKAAGIDPMDFFSVESEIGEKIQNAATKYFYSHTAATDKPGISPDNLTQIAKDVSLTPRLIRIATLITSVIKKFSDSASTSIETPSVSTPVKKDIPQLPAPSDNELGDLSNIERMKDLSGIPRK